jgi:hypothetical protein
MRKVIVTEIHKTITQIFENDVLIKTVTDEQKTTTEENENTESKKGLLDLTYKLP